MKILRNLSVLILTGMLLFGTGQSVCQPNKDAGVQLEAFGGFIVVPNYMYIIVQSNTKESYEIRITRNPELEGGLGKIVIVRPSKELTRSSDGWVPLEKYEVNGFSVELYKHNNDEWGVGLFSASVSRCNDIGHFIFKEKEELDQYLAQVSSVDCS